MYDFLVNKEATTAVTGEAPGVVRIWNLKETSVGSPLTGQTGPVSSLALSSDGRLIASGSTDGAARIWSVAESRAIAVLDGHKDSIQHLHFTPDGTTLVSGQASDFVITGRSGNSMAMKKINADPWIVLWDVNPPKFRRFLGR